jgi:uncharacterized membrane protein YgcG
MKRLAAFAALTLAFGSAVLPALGRESYVTDNAHMLGAAAIARINSKVADFASQTGKEIVVDTEPSLGGATPADAAEKIFAQQQVNGILIYIARDDKKIEIIPDRASRVFFPSGSFTSIYAAMRPSFAAGDFDTGINTGVDLILNQYRSHESSLNRGRVRQPAFAGASRNSSSTGGFNMSWIIWLIIFAVIFFVIRGIFRAIAGPRMYPPGYGGGPGAPMGGPMMGGPGYGAGYGGYGGGGGGFWSGMLGGLGGAFLGNELFGNRGNFGGGYEGGNSAGMNDGGQSQDAGGWQSDAGQADVGNAAGGGWGDSGDSGGGWGGGDGGGGGGDSGGGW